MNFFDEGRMTELVRRDEKDARLSQFIGFYLDRINADWADCPEHHVATLVARSPASPVARAIISHMPELMLSGLAIGVVFARLEPSEQMADWLALAAGHGKGNLAIQIRWARDSRLLDAHEQFVLGRAMSWSGDSMRRDPETRDAFELFKTFCEPGARLGNAAYRTIWASSVDIPQQHYPVMAAAEQSDTANTATSESELSAKPNLPSVNTRH